MYVTSSTAQLAPFRPSQFYQDHIGLSYTGPSISQHSALPGGLPRFLERSSIYAGCDTHSSASTGSTSSVSPSGGTDSGVSSSAASSALCSMASTPSFSVDIPASLAGFKTIAGTHLPSCEWLDTLPLLLPSQLHYDFLSADKNVHPPSPSPSLPAPPPSYSIDHVNPSTMNPSPDLPSSLPGALTFSRPTPSDITQSLRNACANPPRASAPRAAKPEGQSARPREKKHACWMCEKSFDRPSTLRKHLLVHTGEKAFVCETCGRRFGVASNLNRHVKRCILKPVNLVNRSGQMNDPCSTTLPPSSSSVADPAVVSSHTPDSTTSPDPPARSNNLKRPRESKIIMQGTPPDSPSKAASTRPIKRRRRAPSPSQWIPQSLADFNIAPPESTKPTSVPLPPVTAVRDAVSNEWIEERDSWDENVALLPYHPCGWKGTLPGPGLGLGGKDGNGHVGLVNGGTYVMGRLLMV